MLRQATRTKAKIRLGLSAVSGGGKTYSAILIAKGLSNGDLSKVAIIDTENGSADLYAHMGNYNVLTLNAPFSPERYIDAIKTCEDAGMNVIIIDSITHEWDGKGGCLQIQEQLGGKYQDWAKVTPRHQAFIDAILQAKCHMITTVRRKQDYEMTKDAGGKMKVEKAGLKEVTREGFEYELTANIELDIRHNATALKDRTGLFMDQPQFIPSEETGKKLLKWCENGTPTTAEKVELIKTKLNMEEIPAWFLTPEVKKEIHDLIKNSTLEPERQTIAKKSLATCTNDNMVNHIRLSLLKFQKN
jgi:hypothetical protein